MHARLLLVLLPATLLLAAACTQDATPSPTPTTEPSTSATATPTPEPTPTPEFINAIFCERLEGDARVFERCLPGSGGNGFATRLPSAQDEQFPLGTRIPQCVLLDPDTAALEFDRHTFTAVLDQPCVHDGTLRRNGLQPVPALTQDIPRCLDETVLGNSPPATCVWSDPYYRVFDRAKAISFLTNLRACSATIGAYFELAELYDPIIETLHAIEDGDATIDTLPPIAQPAIDYQFDQHVEDHLTGPDSWHTRTLDALAPAVDGDHAAVPSAIAAFEEAVDLYRAGRGCG